MNIETFDNLIDLPPFNIPAQFFRAENPRALIIFLPAMGTVAHYYQPFAETWLHAGYSVMLAEFLDGEVEIMPVNWPGNPHSSWARSSRDLIVFIDRWLRGKDVVR